MPSLRSTTVKLQPALFEQISLIAEKRGETISDTIRHLITRGLDERIYRENTELIAQVVREQLEQVIGTHLVSMEPHYQHHQKPNELRAVDPRRLALCRKIS